MGRGAGRGGSTPTAGPVYYRLSSQTTSPYYLYSKFKKLKFASGGFKRNLFKEFILRNSCLGVLFIGCILGNCQLKLVIVRIYYLNSNNEPI